jgi:Zn-dependent M16 (insulinase) family peptidase
MDIITAFGVFSAATQSIKTAADTGSSLRALLANDKTASKEVKEKLSALLDEIIAAKQINIQVIDAVSALKTELDKYQRFDQLLARYQLTETAVGFMVYKVKKNADIDEPEHYICPNCVEDKIRSILQGPSDYKSCPRYKTGIRIHKPDMPTRAVTSKRRY